MCAKGILLSGVLASLIGVAGETLQAATVTGNAFVDPFVYEFSDQPMFNYPSGNQTREIGPVSMTWSASGPYHGVLDYQMWIHLGQNGSWHGSYYGNFNGVSNGFAATTGSYNWISFSFDQAVSSVGGLLSYGIYGGNAPQAVLRIYGANDTLLETFDLPLEAPILGMSGNSGQFRGFVRDRADIFRFELYGAIVIDDLTISTYEVAEVPLPAGLPLLLSGVLTLLAMRQRPSRLAVL